MEQAASALLSDPASVLVQERSSYGLPRWLGGKESLPVLEIQVRSLGREGPLEEGRATHSRTLAQRFPWTEEPGGLQSSGG